jgi:hypothetical protein
MAPRFYRTFADFEREVIHPGKAVGQTVEDILDDPNSFEKEFLFDRDPYDEDEEEDE